MRVMIVEDEALVAWAESSCLAEAGYVVVGVAAAMTEALRLAERTQPEVALVSARLRDGPTGYVLANELLKRWSITSVIVSGAPPEVGQPFKFVSKPFSEQDLLDAVSSCDDRVHH